MRPTNRLPSSGDPKLVIGYLRVSLDRQELGPEAQREAILAWCRAHGATLVAVHADLGVSGSTPIDRRPNLMAALEDLRARGAGVLLAARRDRLARDVIAAAILDKLVEKSGARVLTADNADVGDGPDAWLMRTVKDAFAQYELLIIRARTRAGLAVKRARRERVGGVAYGYRLDADGVHLLPDEREQETSRVVHALRADGRSLAEIGRELLARGLMPRRGVTWHPTKIARICATPPREPPVVENGA